MSGERYTENINEELVNLTVSTFNNNKLIAKYLEHIELIADDRYAEIKAKLEDLLRKIDPSSIPNHPKPDREEDIANSYSLLRF